MDQVVQPLHSELNRTVEIVVHVTEDLEEAQRNHLVSTLENTGGIMSAEFCPLRYHLMLVRYDRDLSSSLDVLGHVKSQNIHAQLIGPV